jgi:ferredoxin
MPRLTIEGAGTHEVVTGKRLVVAIMEAGVDIGHRCGGWAKCTTCRVEVLSGEPHTMTVAEKDKREAAGLTGRVRLSCQIAVDGDIEVRVLLRASEQPWPDAGPQPDETVTPAAEFLPMP